MSFDFYELLIRLIKAEVDFVVIGGFATTLYGCELVTQDIDICCDFSADNLLRLQSAVADLHPVHRMTAGRRPLELTAETAKTFNNLYLDTDRGQLDCIGEVKGVGDFTCVRQNSTAIAIEGYTLRVLDLDVLIDAKKAMGRPRDLQVVEMLKTLKRLKTKQHKNDDNIHV